MSAPWSADDVQPPESLTTALGAAVKAHYRGNAVSRRTVYEVLAALALMAAGTIRGTAGEAPQTRIWFDNAVDEADLHLAAGLEKETRQ